MKTVYKTVYGGKMGEIISLRIPCDLLARVMEVAQRERRSLSNFIRLALEYYLEGAEE